MNDPTTSPIGSLPRAGAPGFEHNPAILKKNELDVARCTPLAREGAVSQQELDDAIQATQASQASVEAAKAAVDQARIELGAQTERNQLVAVVQLYRALGGGWEVEPVGTPGRGEDEEFPSYPPGMGDHPTLQTTAATAQP